MQEKINILYPFDNTRYSKHYKKIIPVNGRKKSMYIDDYILSNEVERQWFTKDELSSFLEQEHAKIKLALEQLKDIEQMSKEL